MRCFAANISLAIVIVFLAVSALLVHPFGDPPAQMDEYIIKHTQRETGANNAVTAVVFDYRGLDTLGEATILFTAVTGVVMLFRTRKGQTTR
ncbi:MAG: hydrogen gas-evolving membrane-bound hydrogenase subunit E [Thermodesulfobacteriota bacterium]|nr:hydrogen gas-evolving membrane-bound hydrogenase subunit E [Thermodesulfobacteriota bacterium]